MVIIVKHCHIKLVNYSLILSERLMFYFSTLALGVILYYYYYVNLLEADKSIQAEKDETERLTEEKQKLSVKHRNDPELQR